MSPDPATAAGPPCGEPHCTGTIGATGFCTVCGFRPPGADGRDGGAATGTRPAGIRTPGINTAGINTGINTAGINTGINTVGINTAGFGAAPSRSGRVGGDHCRLSR
ncbi:MAG TPA: hypothetical protein VHX59_07655 [Mycobacteriales bacterium]|nr:hypothetical protein [Mycobacteriales bacterium]